MAISNAILAPHEDEADKPYGAMGGGGSSLLAPTAGVASNIASQAVTIPMNSPGLGGGSGTGGGSGGSNTPGEGDSRPGKNMGGPPSNYIPPSTKNLPGSIPNSPAPAPAAPAAPPPPPGTDEAGAKKIANASKEIDEEMQHGFASNILAGAMFQSPPELMRNILLGN